MQTSTPQAMPIASGALYGGKYRLLDRLGEGAAAEVWRAEHVDLHHRVAIKILFPHHARNETLRQRFVDEGRIQAGLRHDHIVSVTDIIDQDDSVAIVMELIEGRSLDSWILEQRATVPAATAASMVCDILLGLAVAHATGVVHRDIKPANILLEQRADGWRPKVSDFGVARVAGSDRTKVGSLVGTANYMAPEQFTDAANVDARADLYAVGIVLFELLTRRTPFEGDSEFAVLRAHAERAPPDPRQWEPTVPAAVVEVVMRALEKRPEDRFGSAAKMREALLRAARGERTEVAARSPRRPAERAQPGPSDAGVDSRGSRPMAAGSARARRAGERSAGAPSMNPLGRALWIGVLSVLLAVAIIAGVASRPSSSVPADNGQNASGGTSLPDTTTDGLDSGDPTQPDPIAVEPAEVLVVFSRWSALSPPERSAFCERLQTAALWSEPVALRERQQIVDLADPVIAMCADLLAAISDPSPAGRLQAELAAEQVFAQFHGFAAAVDASAGRDACGRAAQVIRASEDATSAVAAALESGYLVSVRRQIAVDARDAVIAIAVETARRHPTCELQVASP